MSNSPFGSAQRRELLAARAAARKLERQAKYSRQAAARKKVKNALRSGKMVKPSSCVECGAGGPLDAHHHDYDKPLEVEFLCLACHHLRHPDLSEALFRTRRGQPLTRA